MVDFIVKLILIILSPIFLWLVIAAAYFLYYRFVLKMPIPKSQFPRPEIPGIFKRLFIMFPHRFIDDFFNRDPDAFKEHGLHMFCGEQGAGKTTAVVHKLLELQQRYPRSKVRTNMNYKNEVSPITHWKDLVQNENGIYGQIEVLDEIQTWFSSLQSKDFPPEMITEISQQRKQRKMIVGTAQVFGRIAKPIREQTTYVYLPVTMFGCFTWVRVSKPRYYEEETQSFKRFIKHYFFIHTAEVREAFDTYQKIEKYQKDGFKSDQDRINLVN